MTPAPQHFANNPSMNPKEFMKKWSTELYARGALDRSFIGSAFIADTVNDLLKVQPVSADTPKFLTKKLYTAHLRDRRSHHYTGAGVLAIDSNTGKTLMVKPKQGKSLGLPKGMMEQNETSLQCALRETREETGYNITDYQVWGTSNAIIKAKDKSVLSYLFYVIYVDFSKLQQNKSSTPGEIRGTVFKNIWTMNSKELTKITRKTRNVWKQL